MPHQDVALNKFFHSIWSTVQPKTIEEVKVEQLINKEPPIGQSVSIEELKEEVKPEPVVEVVAPKEEPKLVIEQPKVTVPKHEVHKPKGKKK